MRPFVALYQPRVEYSTMPLGLASIAATSGDADVVVTDGRFDDALPAARPLLFGTSVVSGPPIADALRQSRAFRARHPGVPVVWGGWHASLLPESTVANDAIDVAVIGQGQATFAELVSRTLRGEPLAGTPGTVVKTPQGVVRGPARAFESPHAFPMPRYDRLDVDAYFRASGRRSLDYVSSQGCPYRCAFCSDPKVYNRSWHGLPAERVLLELDELLDRYRADGVSFQDDLFFVNRTRALAIIEGLARRPRPFRWTATMRAQHLVRLDEPELRLLFESGCGRINLGAESGSDDTLDRLQKDQTSDMLLEAARRLGRYKIPASFSFIVGTPGEPPAELERTLARILDIKAANPRIDTPLYRFAPYPGSALVDELAARGAALPETLEDWARCDLYASAVADLSADQVRLVDRFGFYVRIGWSARKGLGPRTVAAIARARVRRRWFGFAIEKRVAEALGPSRP